MKFTKQVENYTHYIIYNKNHEFPTNSIAPIAANIGKHIMAAWGAHNMLSDLAGNLLKKLRGVDGSL